MRYSDDQIAVMLERLQEYVDIGWNNTPRQLGLCLLCQYMKNRSGFDCEKCFPCPLALKNGSPGCMGKHRLRRLSIRYSGESNDSEARKAARIHARWLMKCYNAADENGEWSIE
jgi:hypothetical protein